MNKTIIGLVFITMGLAYGSLAMDGIYNATLGYLVKNKWLTPPVASMAEKNMLGRKTTIIFYSGILIIIGIFILWSKEL